MAIGWSLNIAGIVVAGVLLAASPKAVAATASFDCTKARTPVELLICHDDEVTQAENAAAAAWMALRSKLRDDRMKTAQLLANQKVWIETYAQNCGLPKAGSLPASVRPDYRECVIRALRERAEYLKTVPTEPSAMGSLPFVGCPGAGMGGDVEPPIGNPPVVKLPPDIAGQLAYYASPFGGGAFGPRGWTCRVDAGSGGSRLSIIPAGGRTEDQNSRIGVEVFDSGTSSRFTVAEYAAALFPTVAPGYVAETKREVEETLHQTFQPSRSYSESRLTYLRPNTIRYVVPGPNQSETGAETILESGFIEFDAMAESALVIFSVQLSQNLEHLRATIMNSYEHLTLAAGHEHD